MVRNAEKYYFPVKESILSVLDICDEFIVALGNNDNEDHTRELIESIGSPKIKIINRVWSEDDFIESRIFAKETNFALSQCTGDWCFYIQADEVVHEDDLLHIKEMCNKYLNNKNVEGFLFKYKHFFGDYHHFLPVHGWYKNEIRIVRNGVGVKSIKDAQSFRKENDIKLSVVPINAFIYHYGWVRPPHLMQSKKKEHDSIHHGRKQAGEWYKNSTNDFNYGALGNIPVYQGTHPKVMESFIEKLYWKNTLNYTRKALLNRLPMKHEKNKYKLITWFENTFNNGKDIFGYKNWKIYKG